MSRFQKRLISLGNPTRAKRDVMGHSSGTHVKVIYITPCTAGAAKAQRAAIAGRLFGPDAIAKEMLPPAVYCPAPVRQRMRGHSIPRQMKFAGVVAVTAAALYKHHKAAKLNQTI